MYKLKDFSQILSILKTTGHPFKKKNSERIGRFGCTTEKLDEPIARFLRKSPQAVSERVDT